MALFGGSAGADQESSFWQWFQKNDAMLFDFERDQEHIFDLLADEMHKIDPALTFEFGPKADGRREFVISADGILSAFPKVERLFAAAPQMAHWTVIKFRPRREPMNVQYGGVSVAADAVLATAEPDKGKAGLVVYLPGFREDKRSAFGTVAFLMLDQALGEYDVETKVGFIEVRPIEKAAPNALPLSKLPEAFDRITSH